MCDSNAKDGFLAQMLKTGLNDFSWLLNEMAMGGLEPPTSAL